MCQQFPGCFEYFLSTRYIRGMATKIDSVTARDKITPRRAPFWHRIAKGGYVGFRKMTAGSAGTWMARYRHDESDKQVMQSFGGLEEYPAHERFDRAVTLARSWFEHLNRGGSTARMSVAAACTAYIEHIRREKGDKPANDAKSRFARWVDPTPLAKIDLAKLTRDHVKAYRAMLMDAPVVIKGVEHTRAKDTINRDLTTLRAALNRALADGMVTTDFAWREALKPIKNASRRRELYLDREQRRALIQNAATDVAQLLTGLALLPLRPGAIAALNVADFSPRLRTLRIGHDKAGADRKLAIPDATAKFFKERTAGKSLNDPLLCRADGARWNKDSWKKPIKEAAQAAGLPHETTAYSLRHSVITDLVVGGLDLLTVAQISGTSVAMIEKHYGSLRQSVASDALSKLTL